MTIEVHATFKGDSNDVVLRTDSPDRAGVFVRALKGNGKTTEVFVIIGNTRLTHDEFLKQLETL